LHGLDEVHATNELGNYILPKMLKMAGESQRVAEPTRNENKHVRVQSSHVGCIARLWPTIRQTNTPVEKLKSGWVASSRLPGKIIYFGFEEIGKVRKLVEATYF